MTQPRVHAHDLIDRLPEAQLTALIGLLESIVEPETTLQDAPYDDEQETEAERRAVAEGLASIKRNGGAGVPHTEAMRRLGLE